MEEDDLVPSPIAHSALAFLAWPPLRAGVGGPIAWWRRLALLGLLLFALVAPDFDIAFNLLTGRPAFATHGGPSHSFVAGVIFALGFAAVGRVIAPVPLARLAVIGLLAYWSHILLDAATRGRGVALLWPFTGERIGSPVPLFVGVFHGEDEWIHWYLHALTVGSEALFAAVVWLVALAGRRRGAARGSQRELAAGARLQGSVK